ncbi:MAG: aromatic ring-hydroxylating dioxygenase subunit alpha [Acidimicrobiia bacterium]|nr:aromatic ring-hydroxylating dioxygenase subunit alpha [Acidimicrobiia bacterium]
MTAVVGGGGLPGSSNDDWRSEAAWTGTRLPLDQCHGLRAEAYTDPAFFALEQQQVYERAWVCVGTAADVAAPGRLIVRRLGTRSIIITRDRDGTLRGFLNACRHRGTELTDVDCDVASTIRCPYHRWAYALDGRLRAAPYVDVVPRAEFTKDDHSLVPVRIETWGVLLFACFDPDTPPLHQWLGDLPDRMAGYKLDAWEKREEQALAIDANWKLITENYQEYYHLTWVHPELAKVSRVDDHYRYQGPGQYCGQTTTPVSADERDDWLRLPPMEGLDDSDAVSGRFVAIFPNVLLSVLPNHVFVMRLDPVAPGLTTEVCTFLLPPESAEVDEEAFAPTRSFWFDVNNEDIDIVQRSQRGLTHSPMPAGPLIPRFEEPLHRFHNILADCMTLPSLADITIRPGDDPGRVADRRGTGANPHPAAIDR